MLKSPSGGRDSESKPNRDSFTLSYSLSHSLFLSSPHRHCFSLSVQCVRMWLLGIQFLQQPPSLSAVWKDAFKPPPSLCRVFCRSGEIRQCVTGLDTLNDKLRHTHDTQNCSVEMRIVELQRIKMKTNDTRSDFS